jgi:hypothetical protein
MSITASPHHSRSSSTGSPSKESDAMYSQLEDPGNKLLDNREAKRDILQSREVGVH